MGWVGLGQAKYGLCCVGMGWIGSKNCGLVLNN